MPLKAEFMQNYCHPLGLAIFLLFLKLPRRLGMSYLEPFLWTWDTIIKTSKIKKIWSGPNKVIGVSGKKLFIDRGGHMATVNSDDAIRMGEEFWRADDLEPDQESNVESLNQSVGEIIAQHDVNFVERE